MKKAKVLTPYQIGVFSYQDDADLRADNPYIKQDSNQFWAYHQWRRGWSHAKWYETKGRHR